MRQAQTFKLLAALLSASQVAGHGHVTNIVINGVSYRGWNIDSDPYNSNPPIVVAWQTPNTSNGFVAPNDVGTDDIICHLDAKNARGHAVIAAGDKISFQWTSWPESHWGPVITYLANCGESCETVDKTTLEFFKIDAVGLVDGSNPPGFWGDDQLIENNNSWMVEIPKSIAPGYYVIRHELIALHAAGSPNGAQLYPQCFNLQITGSGTAKPSGVKGTKLYTPTDPGILVNIYSSLDYIIPGPTLIPDAVSLVQSTSAITASGTPITGSGSVPPATDGPSTTKATPTSSTTLSTTTKATITQAPTSSTTSAGSTATQTAYGQCGGSGWTGPTACGSGATCTSYSEWYSQCIPKSG
ncbi:putative endo-1,4-beta-glucanase [Aspergillus clavatus NRRL 1]|uniref:AA9 family lytic polysaccharide monooxygenase n=1 Tax=Aspergillus clavatus (strain ATCC 1007 / CBS 513.65 / DSM 816 / NCTC 3887 / NRRL 1 / QM 1276 / 107) TaxID=344612 RepID=A1CC72_ASPCL|nr:endo-1,4-beta-glucanase, putative [Aspergillus clavatus NRRL 1]EAW12129.1 endo-1,4-beta-glucanase, putative [Aspergillus clavatus NRRL 1]